MPTSRYNEYRGVLGRKAIAVGLREGWSEVFLANENAHNLPPNDLRDMFRNLSGKGEATAVKMASTFKALADLADWDLPADEPETVREDLEEESLAEEEVPRVDQGKSSEHRTLALHTDIHIHLPASSDVTVYTAIFRALREELL